MIIDRVHKDIEPRSKRNHMTILWLQFLKRGTICIFAKPGKNMTEINFSNIWNFSLEQVTIDFNIFLSDFEKTRNYST